MTWIRRLFISGMAAMALPPAFAVVTAVNSPAQTVSTMSVTRSLQVPHSNTPTASNCLTNSDWGKVYVDTDATSGSVFYVCEGVSGWIAQGGSGGGGGGSGTSIRVEDGGVFVVTTSTLNFDGTQFAVTNSGGKALATLDSSSVTLRGNSGLMGPSPTTTNLTEGTNLYYTTARATSAVSATSPLTNTNGVFAAPASSFTLQGNTFNGASQLVQLSASALIPNSIVDPSSVTAQGNTFNGASQLVQLNGSTQLPAVSGVNLTNLNASNLASGTVPNARLDSSSVTMYGPSIPASAVAAGALGTSVIASSLTATGVAAGSYTNTNLTVDAQGRITSATTGSSGGGGGTTIWVQYNEAAVSNSVSTVTFNGVLKSTVTGSGKAGAFLNYNTTQFQNSASTFTADPSTFTMYGPNIPAASISAGSLGASVIASSVGLSGFYSNNAVRTNLGLAIGTDVQAYDADLDDLADGSLTGSKVGSGVPAANIASGSLGASVIASSNTRNITSGQMADSDHGDVSWTGGVATVDNVAAANVAAGVLGSSVRASSFPVSGVTAGTYGSAAVVGTFTVSAQGIVTGASSIPMSISTTNMNASGTASATTFLRGDNSWATPAGSGDAVLAATQTFSGQNTFTSTTTFTSTMTLSGGYVVQLAVPSNGQVLKFDGTYWAPGTDNNSGGGSSNGTSTSTISMSFDGSGSVLSAGTTFFVSAPSDGTILSATMLADSTGTVVVDIGKSDYAHYGAITSITASAPPTITSAMKSVDSTLTGWTTTYTTGDVFYFWIRSATVITKLHVALRVRKP